ncbi:MAG: sigma-70 family RNA polymerase sigma factor [Blastocatellia bacterium]|nr:sigma-70 family RNA polymerase sigma factor [Blastocatellia bacterium]
MLQVDLASRASDATENKEAADPMERTLQRARNGDQAAFAELVRKHQAMVFSLARAFLRDRETAEELAQDVFLSLYQNLGAIESAAHLKFWLRKVAGHRCIDYARKRKMSLVSVEDAPEPFSIFDMPDSLMRATLRRIVATLPEKPRLVVTLRYQEDLDPNEISEILDMPVNTVKSHLRRSLAILREKVGRIIDS